VKGSRQAQAQWTADGGKIQLLALPDIDLDDLSPTSFLANPHGAITGYVDTQEFTVQEDRLKGLTFDRPARDLPKGKRLYTVKAIHRDGRLVQLPFEGQLNNTAGGDPGDAIGLNRYRRKGIFILFDWDAGLPIYCAARECWAVAMREELFQIEDPQIKAMLEPHRNAINTGFCSLKHAQFTLPNRFSESGVTLGTFGKDATTTSIWQA
jgi:hypothetical protein